MGADVDTYTPTKVAQWNEFFLASVVRSGLAPTVTARTMQILHTAIYDAWAAFDPVAVGVHSRIEAPGALTGSQNLAAALEEAIGFAAYTAAKAVFPTQGAQLRAFMGSMGYNPDAPTGDPATAAGIGKAAAQAVLDYRASDFSNAANGYADTTGYVAVNSGIPGAANAPGGPDFDPNAWQPLRVPTGTHVKLKIAPDPTFVLTPEPVATSDPRSFRIQSPLTPHWGEVKAFSLQENSEFRPPAPPRLGDFGVYVDGTGKVTTGDAAYREQYGEVLALSASLTDRQKAIAEFWADGPRTETPPGHWNQLAQDVAVRDGHTLEQDVKLFFTLNNALFDASIATWETKYTYNSIRPQSVIHHLYYDQKIIAWLGPDKGSGEILGQEWNAYQQATFVTPPFPDFTSGHSAFSMAAATVLQNFTGSDVFYDGVGKGSHDLDKDGVPDFAGQYILTKLAFEYYDGPPIDLTWETFSEAAEEAGISRLYGGIHFQDANLFGRGIGLNVGESAWDASLKYISGSGDALLQSPVGTSANDLLIGSGRAETFDAGAGNDVVRPNGGGDTVTLGAGNDRIEGLSFALDQLLVKDFAAGDSIVLLGLATPSAVVASATTGGVLLTFGDYDIKLEGAFAPGQIIASLSGSDTVIALVAGGGLAANLGESFSLAADTARLTLLDGLTGSLATSAVI
jgi:hypothetical protein